MAASNQSTTLAREKLNVDYWNAFYKNVRIEGESTFCTFMKSRIGKNALILDIGCGSGRDAFAFAKDGYAVFGLDQSIEAIKLNMDTQREMKLSDANIRFQAVNISDSQMLFEVVSRLSEDARLEEKYLVIYLRFVLHSISEYTEKIFLSTISNILKKGDIFAAEFRTIEDQERTKVYDGHYRRFIVAEDLVDDMERNYDYTKEVFLKGLGFSVFNNEDPYLARIIMKKN